MVNESDSAHEKRLQEVLVAFIEAAEAGHPVDRAALFARHPEFAAELNEFFAGRSNLERLAEPLRAHTPAAVADAPTTGLAEGAAAVPALGTRIHYFGDYELLAEIGRGGMGVVYKARQVSLKRIVALKMILTGQLADEADVRRFHAEAQAAAKLDHPGIVTVFEVGKHDGHHYFSMAFVEGESLARQLAAGLPPPRQAAELTKKVAEAVSYAHVEGVVHRDLKPANILIDKSGQPRLTDFGLAKRVGSGHSAVGSKEIPLPPADCPLPTDLTATGQVLGTPSYMPPEQASGQRGAVGPVSDVYSLGAVLYCLVTGRPPFQAATALDTLLQVLDHEPVSPRQLNSSVPRDLETICLKCLQKEPRKRYASARELAADLDRFLAGQPVHARRIGSVGRGWRWCRRKPALAAACALAVTAVVTTVVLSIIFAVHQSRAADRNQRLLAESYLDRGQTLCDQGDSARGLLWLGRSLEFAPARAADLQHLIRANLSAWAPPTPRLRKVMKHAESVGAVRFSNDGKILLTADYKGDGTATARLWDTATGNALGVPISYEWVKDVALSPDGTMIATGQGEDRMIDAKLWNAATGKLIRSIPLPEDHRWGTNWGTAGVVKFSPDGKTLFTRNGMLVDVATGKFAKRISRDRGDFECVVFSSDGKCLATAVRDYAKGGQNVAYVVDLATGKVLGPAVPCEGAVAINSDGKTLLAGGSDGTAQLWDVASGKTKGPSLRHRNDRRHYNITTVALSPDDKLILTAMNDGTSRLWDAASGTPIGLPLPHPDGVRDVAFSPDGKTFLTGSSDKTARVWDIPDRQAAEILLPHANAKIHDLAFSPDGKVLAVASGLIGAVKLVSGYGGTDVDQMGQVHFWDRPTGKLLGGLTMNEGPVFKMAFSPDSSTLATYSRFADPRRGGGGLVHLLDVQTRKTIGQPLECKENGVSDLAFGPDGKTLITTDQLHYRADGTSNEGKRAVRTWDLATRKIISETYEADWGFFSPDRKRKLIPGYDNTVVITGPGHEKRQIQHQAAVVSATFSADGVFLLTGSQDNTARLWHLATLKPIGPSIKHQKQVTAVAFSPDGKSIMTGSEDGIVRLAPMPPPIEGEPERIGLWVEALTGARLDGLQFLVLSADQWLERKQRVESMGGSPLP